ncbi:MAG: ribulose-phosphate 3-epimerase, partial [Alphaproteobacteria bacterium]|nr:ribulose-phosphate 3-epimerase [Alphaproteobacteria bacterium]
VMDGHFVPNLSIGAPVIKKLRPWTKLPFDVHLMMSPVDPFIEDFAEAGANSLTVHPEASPHIYRTLQAIKAVGCKAGIALNPGTSVEVIKPLLSVVDLILVMTVNPGFSGQEFLVSQLQKIREVRTLINEANLPILLQVDGGISPLTAPSVIKAGADILVAGQAIFNTKHYQENIQALRGKID